MRFDNGWRGGVLARAMENPFLSSEFLIRWSAMCAEQVAPAVETALQRAQAAVERIAALDLDACTFESTFAALEQATDELTRTWAKVTHLQSVADAPALREAHNAMLPRVTSFFASIPLNPALWVRLQRFAESPVGKSVQGIRRRLMEEMIRDFREAGADLPEEKRARLQALQGELAQLTQKYSENVLDATNAWQLVVGPEDEHRLAGLPERAKEAARRSASSKGVQGWRFTLHFPSLEPFLTYVEDAALRREMWTASAEVGAKAPYDNSGLIGKILALRAEKARLLGREHFADLVLQRRMARSGRKALAFTEDFQHRCAAAFTRECREIEDFKAQLSGGARGRLAPWDLLFYAEKLRQARYSFDEEALRPYFPMDRVIAGMFELVRRVFGLEVTALAGNDFEAWHADVKCYSVNDRHGRHVGSFYADWHPREAKRGGAWMNFLITGGPGPDGRRDPHLGLMCGNLTPPAGDQPALLTHREVETVFHEFGHLLHHLLGEVEFKSLNGVNVAWDFVELPSQLMENWTWERESLDLIARHHATGAAIPEEIFQRMVAARNFRSACTTMRQVAFAKLDLVLHMRTEDFLVAEIEPRARAAISDCLVPTEPPAPTILKRFTHIFGDPVGYAAGYYSYKWAEVLDADVFTRFKREGIFNAAVGAEFVDKILSRGNSADPGELFRAFMGRDPDPGALLARAGLQT